MDPFVRGDRRALGVTLMTLALMGCAEAAQESEVPRPVPARETLDFMPEDLDVVVRLDGRRVRPWLSRLTVKSKPGTLEQLTMDTILASNLAYVGMRLSKDFLPRDYVLIAEGIDEKELGSLRAQLALHEAVDRGGGIVLLEAKECTLREQVCRAYYTAEQTLILVSLAEQDAAERTIIRAQPGTKLRPEGSGSLSATFNLREVVSTLRSESPKAAEFLAEAKRVNVSVQELGGTLSASLVLDWVDAERADRALQGMAMYTTILSKSFGFPREIVKLERVLGSTLLRVELPVDAFRAE
jgi:hypothetical protein